jgi:hypothetical protein
MGGYTSCVRNALRQSNPWLQQQRGEHITFVVSKESR